MERSTSQNGSLFRDGFHIYQARVLECAILSRGAWKEILRQVHQEEEEREKSQPVSVRYSGRRF